MSETLVWWFVMQVVGLAALPLCLALFRNLPDRGYAFSKAFGLLTLGYVFWILNVMRIVPNTTGGIWISLFLIIGASGLLVWRRQDEIAGVLRERLWLIGVTEVVLFLAFVTAAYLRSYVPDLTATEKPMDFMYLNAVTHGGNFPPQDPWLSGHNISYYYFGYLLVSIVTRLSGVATGIGFNLGLAMIAALAVTGAFGLVYNLTAPRERQLAEAGPGTPGGEFAQRLWRPVIFGVVAGLLLAVMGNLEGILEALASQNVGAGHGFWSWANVDPSDPVGPYSSAHWWPDKFLFWWRATRILDVGEGIHEFPFFSFLLGDLHPHVMAIPFVLLALGVALNLFRSDGPLDLVVWLERPLWLVAFAVVLGGLAFLNTWDLPTMAFVITLAALLRNRLNADDWSWGLGLDTAGFVLPLYLLGALAYTPFFFGGFSSQASGFTAETGAGSGLFHTLLIWGTFATIVLPYAVWRLSRSREKITMNAVLWALAPALTVVFLWLVWDGLALIFNGLPPAIRLNDAHAVGNRELSISFGDRATERGWNWLTVIAIGGALSLLVLALVREVNGARKDDEGRLGHVFALALATTAALLIFGTEFVFIEDTFSKRLNTIFKLYYQAWILLSVAGGFALYELWRELRSSSVARAAGSAFAGWSSGEVAVTVAALAGAILGIIIGGDLFTSLLTAIVLGGLFFVVSGGALAWWRSTAASNREASQARALGWRGVWAGAVSVVLIAGFVYPLLATYNRTNSFDLPRGLNGLDRMNGDDRLAINCLAGIGGRPVIAEALGDDYSTAARISASTGLPTVLGWRFHEVQWRGTDKPYAGRPEDLQLLYTGTVQSEVQAVIQRYNIRYVVVGEIEQQQYQQQGVTVQDNTDLFEPVSSCTLGNTAVYRVRPGVITPNVAGQ